MQRSYAYTMLALRELAGLMSSERWAEWTEWKTTTAMVVAQEVLILTAFYAVSAATGHLLEIIRNRNAFVGFFLVLGVALYSVNAQAQSVLLPRFRQEYFALKKGIRVSIGVAMLLATVVLITCGAVAAKAARGLV